MEIEIINIINIIVFINSNYDNGDTDATVKLHTVSGNDNDNVKISHNFNNKF